MESVFRDPKTPSAWVELDFHARQRRLKIWKRRLTWGALIFCVIFIGGSIAASLTVRRTSTWYQAAPLSSAHAIFNDDCAKCHSMAFQTAKRFWPGNADQHTVQDANCKTCHPTATEHHGKFKDQDGKEVIVAQPACVSCHREHRGREQLARVADAHCLDCHKNLKARYDKTEYADVTAFPDGHPDFAVWEKDAQVTIASKRKADGSREYVDVTTKKGTDPGLIRFNHRRHLNLNERLLLGQKMPDCVECHQPEETKRYMKPVSHEEHCARCHEKERSFLLSGTFQDDNLKQKVTQFARTSVPHTEPRTIRDVLEGRLRRFVEIDNQNYLQLAEAAEDTRPWVRDKLKLTWKSAPKNGKPTPFDAVEEFVKPQLAFGERMLYDTGTSSGCGKCHDLTREAADRLRRQATKWETKQRELNELPEYDRPQLPARWLLHARFDHASHRELKCTACHDVANSTKTADVLLPKMDACASCHSVSAPGGGARHECISCHNYHEHVNVNAQRFDTIEDALRR